MRPDGGGRRDRGRRAPRDGYSRRTKNRRYRHNCRVRSRLLIASWNAKGVCSKSAEFSRWLSDEKVDVAVIQEATSGQHLEIPEYQTAVISRRARGRRGTGPVRGGDVATLVRNV